MRNYKPKKNKRLESIKHYKQAERVLAILRTLFSITRIPPK